MPWDNPILVVPHCIPSQLQNLNPKKKKKPKPLETKNKKQQIPENEKRNSVILTNLNGEVFKDGREVDRGAGADTLGV